MKILLTGATGFVGQALVRELLAYQHEVVVLTRGVEKARQIFSSACNIYEWNGVDSIEPDVFLGVSAIINLMGENLSSKKWSSTQKQKIYDSRILGTRALVSSANQYAKQLKVFVSTSAIGYYGNRGEEVLTENSARGSGFLSDVCVDWEAEAFKINSDVRTVVLRFGVVLGHSGGAFSQMLPLFKLGLGGRLGSGSQWMSWIHLKDLTNIFLEVLQNSTYKKIVNAVSPIPVTNRQFTSALGQVIKRPTFFSVPTFALKGVLGEMSSILLESQRVIPSQLNEQAFDFLYKNLFAALTDLCQKRA